MGRILRWVLLQLCQSLVNGVHITLAGERGHIWRHPSFVTTTHARTTCQLKGNKEGKKMMWDVCELQLRNSGYTFAINYDLRAMCRLQNCLEYK